MSLSMRRSRPVQRGELVSVEQVVHAAARHEQPRVGRVVAVGAMAQHRHQRHQARAAGDQQQRAALLDAPGEMAADRAAQLELVAGAQLLGQVRGDLAVVDPLDGQRQVRVLGRGGERIRALGLIAVLGGQAKVDVLSGDVAGPVGIVEQDRARVAGLRQHVGHRRRVPDDRRARDGQSLQ
jgi:hypothetical protein